MDINRPTWATAVGNVSLDLEPYVYFGLYPFV